MTGFGYDKTHAHKFERFPTGAAVLRMCECGETHVLWHFDDGTFGWIPVPDLAHGFAETGHAVEGDEYEGEEEQTDEQAA